MNEGRIASLRTGRACLKSTGPTKNVKLVGNFSMGEIDHSNHSTTMHMWVFMWSTIAVCQNLSQPIAPSMPKLTPKWFILLSLLYNLFLVQYIVAVTHPTSTAEGNHESAVIFCGYHCGCSVFICIFTLYPLIFSSKHLQICWNGHGKLHPQ